VKSIAVIDTNVIVSGLISPNGPPAKIIYAWIYERFLPVLSEPLLSELKRTIQKPSVSRLLTPDIHHVIDGLSFLALFVPLREHFHVCRDVHDDMLFDTAKAGKATYIVSGDKAVLEVEFRGLEIITPAFFLEKVLKCE
jgi:uncharacterized protein